VLVEEHQQLLLLDPVHAPQRARRDEAATIAHELAHQWFGDLVTTGWWNDIWLNEGFATWAEAKIVERYKPAYQAHLAQLAQMGEVMATDSLKSARAVRQPVSTTGEAMEAFDGITYTKGAAVLGMLEHMIGPDVFQKGVEQYLRDHAWKTASADDLMAALSNASGKDVGKVASTFLDRPGVPDITFGVDCAGKPPSLHMTQAPWHLFGDTSAAAVAPWIVPVDVRASAEELRVVLADTASTYPLSSKTCPGWVDPNVGDYGYYRYSLDEKGWRAFAGVVAKQPDATRLSFVQGLWAGVRAGTLGPEIALRLLPALDGEQNRIVLDAVLGVLGNLRHQLVTPEAASAYAAYVSQRLLPRYRALTAVAERAGRAKARALTPDEVLERQSLFWALGALAEDPATLAEANKLALLWLANPASVDGDLAQSAVTLGSKKAGPDRLEALRAAMKGAKSPNDRQTALAALGGFDDPATLDKAMSIALTDEVATQDMLTVLWGPVYRPSTRAWATKWIMAHWDAVRARLPADWAGYVFAIAGEACTKDEIDEDRAFLTPKVPDVEGSARPLAEGLEGAERCRALHEKASGAVDRFFKVKAK